MTNRITENDLSQAVKRINKAAGFGNDPDHNMIGLYSLSYAYGGVKLVQNTKGGGQRDISTGGFGTKRALYTFMQGMQVTPNQFSDNDEGDMAALDRIENLVRKEGFTGGEILDAIKKQREYVRNGGTL